MASRTVVVMGGGTGGLVAARELRRRLDASDRVVLIDRSPTYSFAPSFLWVMTGARRPAQVTADLRRLRRKGIEVLTSEVRGIDLDGRRVETADGAVACDRLGISLGIELAPEALPGFVPAAHNVYDLPGALAAGRALRAFEGGRVAVL
ncbi:MAG: NAD(P)/FAD-dependent oxidoreductase, partial [Actinobacteria bacterium]|nr:NAD(P)/FAD-dependent oxidoreductase [Actinomycetota bacterium]